MEPSDRARVTRAVRVRNLAQGEELFHEGDAGESLFIITAGRLAARAKGKSKTALREMGPGELVGEMSCIDPAPRSVTVVAVSPATVYELDRVALEGLRTSAPRAAATIVDSVIATVTSRLRELDLRVAAELRGTGPDAAPPSARSTEPAEARAAGLVGRLVGWLRGSE